MAELKRLVELGNGASTSKGTHGNSNSHGSIEDVTELEYLRNILFEYMMGRQSAVRLFELISEFIFTHLSILHRH